MPTLILNGDSKGAVRAAQDLTEEQRRHGQEVKKVEAIYDAWGQRMREQWKQHQRDLSAAKRESEELGRAAARIIQENEGPQERYNRKVGELSRLFVAGKLNVQQMDQALDRYRGELDRVGPAQEAAFGEAAVAQLAGYGQGVVSVSAIVSALAQAFRQVEQDAQAAADAVFNTLASAGQLQQVIKSGPDGLKMLAQARQLSGEGLFPAGQQSQALDLVFALRNAEYNDSEIATILGLGKSREVPIKDLETVAVGLKKYQNTFGASEAGDINQVLQKVRVAAGTMQTNFPEAARAATLFGSEASALKFSDEEALAAFVAIEKQSPGTEEAATRLRGLFTQIAQHKLQKGSLSETLKTLVDRVRGGEQAIDVVGEMRAAAGLNILAGDTGYKTYLEQVGVIQDAQNQPSSVPNLIDLDPRLRAANLRARFTGQREMSDEELWAEKENLYDALREAQIQRLGGSTIGRGFTRLMQGWIDVTGQEAGAFRAAQRAGGYDPELMQALNDYLERTARGVEDLNTKVRDAPLRPGVQER